MLDNYEFGFELNESGEFRACVKEPVNPRGGIMGWFFNIPQKQWNYEGDFRAHLRDVIGVNIGSRGSIYFNSMEINDCNKFAKHVVEFVENVDLYEGYEITEYGDHLSATKWLSANEYKEFMEKAIKESVEKNERVLYNKNLFKVKGRVFVKCRIDGRNDVN